jgi:hypothetical protein
MALRPPSQAPNCEYSEPMPICRIAGNVRRRERSGDPTGKSAGLFFDPSVNLFLKNILIFRSCKSVHITVVPSHRGAARDRHGRGAGCGGRG